MTKGKKYQKLLQLIKETTAEVLVSNQELAHFLGQRGKLKILAKARLADQLAKILVASGAVSFYECDDPHGIRVMARVVAIPDQEALEKLLNDGLQVPERR